MVLQRRVKVQKSRGVITPALRASLLTGVHEVLHLRRPLQKSPEVAALAPQEFPELDKTDLLHFQTAVGFNAPQEIGAAPRGKPVASACVPQESSYREHVLMITAAGSVMFGGDSRRPRAHDRRLEFVLLHQMPERPVRDFQHIGGARLHAIGLLQRGFQQRPLDVSNILFHIHALGQHCTSHN